MPTPNESILATTLRPHPSCPDLDTTLSSELSNDTAQISSQEYTTAAEAFPNDDNDDGNDNDNEATPTKARVGQVDEETAIESDASSRRRRSTTTAEPESVSQDPYYYPMSSDLGFALTPETALTFSEAEGLRVRLFLFLFVEIALFLVQKLTPAVAAVALPRHMQKRPSYLSSLFRPGSRFTGTQTDKQTYNVEVQIQQVDMRQSTMCGYLKIDG